MKQYNRLSWTRSRLGFVMLLVALVWAKMMLASAVDFSLFSAAEPVQWITMLISPITVPLLMIGSALYFRKARYFYSIAILMYIINVVLIQLNVIYFREFTDFMSVSVMLGYNKVNQGLGASGFALTNWHDILYWIDFLIIPVLFFFKKIRFSREETPRFTAFAVTTFALFAFLVTFAFGEAQRPQLITRQFDSKEMVKDLGLDTYTIVDGIKTHGVNQMRKNAKKSDIDKVRAYLKGHYAAANPQYAGIAKGKNVFVIHLESFQQFLIDLKINGQEVTPFLNSIYHSNSTIGFDNFFNQVGQGKTSDAENMLETSTFGLPQGSLFATQGSSQTFQAMPAILNQDEGYASAVFHGNNASFWNRNNTYKNMGYQYFFDASYYDTSGDKAMGYGLKDKLLFNDSIKYLEHIQQPFYAKYITVTNHFPYTLDDQDKNPNFTTTNTGNSVVDGYFQTANYLDASIKEFYDYLDKSGLAKNSIVVIYGDHYGISNSENKSLASVLGKDPNTWNSYDDAMLQRVPFMINIPGYTKGYTDHTYSGEVDVMPTLEHLLGITDTSGYIQFGQDLLSTARKQLVAFRNKDFVTPDYAYINKTIYDNKTGQVVNNPSKKLTTEINNWQKAVSDQLGYSDDVNQKDLLRFYTPKGFKSVDGAKYNYANGLAKLEKLEQLKGNNSKSLFSENGKNSTVGLYQTDAPEKDEPKTNTSRIQQVNPDGGDSTDGGSNTPNP
ncbi:phosphatidylglycerol-membrane-oligosaccharide glycerophosphotransferase [Weissella oryzae SG25]|uniref:Phosphatidylglycerol-membrane-oligosaccharide glycerophosphotransferase n=1 Tax=Weissella oryzae (strain DSM 25784 / JCM 18191 / LMG 30913 / SG25) TaxID=1329250 RepID=A0A069CR37_WEIOS|nr:LTA synthase family protein [Weissella oryzae]GAK30200.1 phosphatidylglycerol-membrane-oligosaccharide glycerophosphotransferase [Weissella oryzae SG25]